MGVIPTSKLWVIAVSNSNDNPTGLTGTPRPNGANQQHFERLVLGNDLEGRNHMVEMLGRAGTPNPPDYKGVGRHLMLVERIVIGIDDRGYQLLFGRRAKA